MIERIVMELGPWNWMVLGCVLLALEIVIPGIFLLWIGVAALVVGALSLFPGALSLLIWDIGWWTWQVQVIVFLVLSVIFAYGGSRLMRPGKNDSDQPLLNRRSEQLIGKVATLTEPITNGSGRIRIGDTLWRVTGPDLPVGTQVRVKAATAADLELVVEKV